MSRNHAKMTGSATAARRLSAVALVLAMTAGLVLVATPAQAVVAFDVRPLSWDVIGLDSNKVADGPNVYEVGARACNTGNETAGTIAGTLVWDGPGINGLNSSTTLPTTQSEVQTLTLTGGAAGDLLYLENGSNTSSVAITMPVGGFANVTAADVKAAILGLTYFAPYSAAIAVVKAGNVYTVTFSGALGNKDVPNITAHAAANEVQRFVLTGGANNNTLTFGDSSGNATTLLTLGGGGSADAVDVTNSVQTIPGYVGTTTISGTEAPTNTFDVTFAAPNLGNQNRPPITVVASTGTATGDWSTITQGSALAPNTFAAAGTMVVTTQGNGAANWVNIQEGADNTQVIHGVDPNECVDIYFNVEVVRNSASWFWTRPYHILVQNCPSGTCAPILSGPGNVPPSLGASPDVYQNTPNNRQIYVEKILSQNRNYVASTGNGGACRDCGLWQTGGFTDADGPGGTIRPTGTRVGSTTQITLGQTYNFTLVASTATGGYRSWSSQINWPRGIFQILNVRTQLQQFPSTVNGVGCCFEDSDPYTYPNPIPPTNLPTPGSGLPNCSSATNPTIGPAIGTFGCNGVIAQTWANAGGFCENVPTPGNIGCPSPVTVLSPPGNTIAYRATDAAAGNQDTAGNLVYITFTLKVVKVGQGSTSAVVWDGSGSSYHYNGDYDDPTNFYTFCASVSGSDPECDDAPPFAASFGDASAVRTPDGTKVTWDTAAESDNLGFNVYTGSETERVKVNEEIIAGTALEGGSLLRSGGTYSYLAPASADAFWVEAVGLDGTTQMHGPISVTASEQEPRSRASSPTLSALGSDSAASVTVPRTPQGPSNRVVAASVARGDAVKIDVDHEAWYRVPLADIAAAGLDTSDPSRLHLWASGVQQALQVHDGAIEFYGLGLDIPSTDTRVYWLTEGDPGAPTIQTVSPTLAPDGPTSFWSTVQRRDRSIYFSAPLAGSEPNFFGSPVFSSGTNQIVNVPDVATAGGATIAVDLQGLTDGQHDVDVELNGQLLGQLSFAGREEGKATFPATGLLDGDNTVRLTSSAAMDVSLVDRLAVTYQRTLTAQDDVLRFTAPGGSRVTVDGFTDANVRIADVTIPAAPVEIHGDITTDPGGSAITANLPGVGERTFYAFTQPDQPLSVRRNEPSSLFRRTNHAEMLIITTKGLRQEAMPLAYAHIADGLRTRVIDVEDVYDEFAAGTKGPESIRDFLKYARRSWSGAPRYVLLAGDGSRDPRGFMGQDASDLVPTKMLDTRDLEAPSDTWLADANGDARADLAIGRLPADSEDELQDMVEKTLTYMDKPRGRAAALPYSGATDYDFEGAALRTAEQMKGLDVQLISGNDGDAHAKTIDAFNAGPAVVNYIGHGTISKWGGGMLDASDAASLTNITRPTFLLAMSCLNGSFSNQGLESLSEALLSAEGGAAAVWTSSAFTYPKDVGPISKGFYGALARNPDRPVGLLILDALKRSNDEDQLKTWILFGDPAVGLR